LKGVALALALALYSVALLTSLIDTGYHITDRNQLFSLEKVKSMLDLGVRFDSNLTFRDHISEKINKAYSVLGIIKRNFIYMDEDTFILL